MEDSTAATCRKQNRLGAKNFRFTCRQVVPRDSAAPSARSQKLRDKELVEDFNSLDNGVVIQRIHYYAPGSVAGVAAAFHGCFTVVPGVSAEASLLNLARG